MPTKSAEPDPAVLAMAEEIFAISTIAWQVRHRNKETGGWDLSETEYLTLDLLARQDRLNVGQLQRRIGVLPAQMSRVIRALESKFDQPLIASAINPDDKRKVDVSLTPAGRKAHQQFRQARLSQAVDILAKMPTQDLEDFMRVVRRMHQMMAQSVKPDES